MYSLTPYLVLTVQMDPTIDHELATHVLHSHMYRNPGETDGEALRIDSSADILITETPDVCLYESNCWDKLCVCSLLRLF